jgi:hypothetical protein
VAAKERVRARARAKESLERTRVITRVKGRRSKTLVVVPSTTPVTSASSLHDITNRNARNTTLSFQKPAMSAFVLNCRMRRLVCTLPVETLLMVFQDDSKSFVEDGMWDMVSSAKLSNPPLSKAIFLQEHGLSDDHWEDETYGDHEHDENDDDESDEDN